MICTQFLEMACMHATSKFTCQSCKSLNNEAYKFGRGKKLGEKKLHVNIVYAKTIGTNKSMHIIFDHMKYLF